MQVSWDGLNAQIAVCEQCELCRGIHHKVSGQGDPRAPALIGTRTPPPLTNAISAPDMAR